MSVAAVAAVAATDANANAEADASAMPPPKTTPTPTPTPKKSRRARPWAAAVHKVGRFLWEDALAREFLEKRVRYVLGGSPDAELPASSPPVETCARALHRVLLKRIRTTLDKDEARAAEFLSSSEADRIQFFYSTLRDSVRKPLQTFVRSFQRKARRRDGSDGTKADGTKADEESRKRSAPSSEAEGDASGDAIHDDHNKRARTDGGDKASDADAVVVDAVVVVAVAPLA